MRFWHKDDAVLALVCAVALLLPADEAAAQDAAMPLENVRIPLENYADGAVKTQLKAARAQVPPSGAIVASNVVFELFAPDGSTNAVITADDCRYDRSTGEAQSASNLRIERGELVITGKGFQWQAEKERVKILSLVRVVFQRDLSKTRDAQKKGRKEHVQE